MTDEHTPEALRSVKNPDWPRKVYVEQAVIRFPNGICSGSWVDRHHPSRDTATEYVRADIADELLEALELVVKRCGPKSADGAIARAAIAKARGQRDG